MRSLSHKPQLWDHRSNWRIRAIAALIGAGLSGVVPALASLVVGAPSLRLKGLYLAITTLAFSFIICSSFF